MKASSFFRVSLVVSAGSCLLAANNCALAQSVGGGSLEEIIVTARKRSENLQTTPVAVTAVTPEALETRQILEVTDLARAAPSLAFITSGTGGARAGALSMRGQAQANGGQNNDAPVALYIDGVYYARIQTNNGELLDMAGVEVLRGPQGTLFGRNTTGGALNMTTQAPVNEFEGLVRVGAGDYSQRTAEAVLNVPLSETVATRFAGSYEERDGYVHNLTTGKDVNDVDKNSYVRGSIQWSPSSGLFNLRVTGDQTRYRDNGTAAAVLAANPSAANPPALAFFTGQVVPYLHANSDFYNDYSGVVATGINGLPNGAGATGNPEIDRPHNITDAEGINANLDVTLGDMTLKSISAYRESDSKNGWDLDGSPVRTVAFVSEYYQHQFSQELQLSGTAGRFDWITGLYYFKEKGFERSDAWQFQAFSRDDSDYSAESKGAFAQANYRFTDRLRATAGFRYTWDKRDANRHGLANITNPTNFVASGVCAVGPNAGQPASLPGCDDIRSRSFSYPAWLASIDYQLTDDMFIYGKTSGAALAGGINLRAVPAGQGYETFEPEKVEDVEIGFKADLLDHKLRTNTAVFAMRRRGYQANVNQLVAGRSSQFQINAGTANYYGIEFEITALPWRGMQLDASTAYLHAKYKAGSFVLPNLTGSGTVDHSDEDVQQAPKWTLSLAATQSVDLGWSRLSAHVDYSYVASRAFAQATFDPTSGVSQAVVDQLNMYGRVPSVGIYNARLTLNLTNPNLELALWGRNVAGKEYIASVFTGLYNSTGIATGTIGAPRTYGLTATYSF